MTHLHILAPNNTRFYASLRSAYPRLKIREEEKASGIAPEHSAFHDSMEDIIERFKARDKEDQRQAAANKEQADADAAVAADMRKASMETFSQTKKRKGGARCEKRQEGYRIRYSSFF